MAQLDKKKIESALKSLGAAGKSAVAALNDMTDGEFRESPLEKDPLDHLHFIVNALKKARGLVDETAKYEGLTEDEVVLAQEAERKAEQEALQQAVQEKLARRQPAPVEPDETDDELVGSQEESDLDPDKPADPAVA